MAHRLLLIALSLWCIEIIVVSCGGTGGHPDALPCPRLREYNTAPSAGLPTSPLDGKSTFRWVIDVPYVKEVILPVAVVEDTEFTMTLRVSASYRPAVLNGVAAERIVIPTIAANGDASDLDLLNAVAIEHQSIPEDISNSVFLDTRVQDPYGSGVPTLTFKYHVEGLPPGKTRIAYFAATDPEHGGIGWFWDPWVGAIPGDPVEWIEKYVEKWEIIIEILPREGGGSGSD